MKSLVVYFSAEKGKTRSVAESFADSVSADIWEIKPEKLYSKADLNWKNPVARCNREKMGKKDVPIVGSVSDWDSYDTIFLGFPIWYFCAPNIVNTFCKAYDWSGKNIYLFATSDGSGIGKTAEKLSPHIKGGKVIDARRVTSSDELADWIK